MSDTSARPTRGAPDARALGRGFLLITGAKLWFLVTGTLINIGLPRLLGSAARFGDYKVVSGLLAIVNMVMIAGTLQAVAKRTSERPAWARAVRASAHRMQALFGGGLALAMGLGAGPLARGAFDDPSLTPLLQIGALIVAAYAFYAVQVGLLNGLERFSAQAGLDATFSTIKAALMLGAVAAGLGVAGALGAFALTALLVLGLSFVVVRRVVPAAAPDAPRAVPLLGFMGQVMGYALALNLLLQLDALLLKALPVEPARLALAAGPGAVALALARGASAFPGASAAGPDWTAPLAREASSALAGLYGAAKNVGIIPYQLILSLTFVVFPLVSRSTFEGDRATTRTYVRQTLRFTTLLVAAFAAMLYAARAPLVALLFGPAWAAAVPALAWLLAATVAFALFVVACTVISGAGRPGVSLALGLGAAALSTAAVAGAVVGAGPYVGTLALAAQALCGATALAAAAAIAWLARAYGPVVPWASLGRAALATAVLLALDRLWRPAGLPGLLGASAGAALVYGAVVAVLGEVGANERARLLALVRRTRGGR